jgi:hypothetical protein
VAIIGRPAVAEGKRLLIDDDEVSIALDTTDDRWFALLAISGGRAVQVFGELGAEGLDPVATESLAAKRIGAA